MPQTRLELEKTGLRQELDRSEWSRWEEYQHPQMRKAPAMIVNLDDQSFLGPEEGGDSYTSIGVLNPCITIERHGQQIHIAARFNIETTIQDYSSAKRFASQAVDILPMLITLSAMGTNYSSTTYAYGILTIQLKRSLRCGRRRMQLGRSE
jgi:hypothetical protein